MPLPPWSLTASHATPHLLAPVLSDLTGGLDSRLVASAAYAAGLKFAVTVNGPPVHQDMRIAHRVAETMQ